MHMSRLLNKQLKLIDKTKGIEKAKYQYELGLWYEQGLNGLSERSDLAIIWYKRAAKNGSVEALYNLAIAYANGTHAIKTRLDLAVRCFETAAEKGHIEAQSALPEAQYNLASAYAYARHGFEDNPELAVLYYQKATKNGSVEAESRLPNAHYELAVVYQHGTYGIEKNIDHAIYYYKLASEKGISEASYNLACIYKDRAGISLEEQGHAIEEALYYFKQASFQGDEDAAIEIEKIYKEGLAKRPEPPKPKAIAPAVPEGFNRKSRRENPQTVIRKDDGTLGVEGRITVLQIAEHQAHAEPVALTPGFDHDRQSTTSNHTYGKLPGSKTALDLRTESQKENRQENPPYVQRKHPAIPVFSNTARFTDESIEDYEFSEAKTFKPL